MKVGFVGLGKLGLPVALAIAARGHEVCAWDERPEVRDDVLAGRLPPAESAASGLLSGARLRLVPTAELARRAEVIFVAVQTPHEPALDGSGRLPGYRRDFDYSHLKRAVRALGPQTHVRATTLTIAVISTVLPGTMRREVLPLIPSGTTLAYNPFFTGMGTTVRDFLEPEFVLLGVEGERAEESARTLRGFYRTLHDRPVFSTDLTTAELTKVAYNTFIGQKIVFANAMMELSHKVGANVDDLTAALSLATDRVVSARYLSGGMGDGGPCHPRDNIALSWLSDQVELSHDIFGDMMGAREQQTEWLADLIVAHAGTLPVVILGKAFKPGTSLVDGSSALLLAGILRERGIAFSHHDAHTDGDRSPAGWDSPCLFFIATKHAEYRKLRFPRGSVVLDPWGFMPEHEEVTVISVGRRGPNVAIPGRAGHEAAHPGDAQANGALLSWAGSDRLPKRR